MPADKEPSLRVLFERVFGIDLMSPEVMRPAQQAQARDDALGRQLVRGIRAKLPLFREQEELLSRLRSSLPAGFDLAKLAADIVALGNPAPKAAEQPKRSGRGRPKGRGNSPKLDNAVAKLEALRPGRLSVRQMAQKLGLPLTTVRRALNQSGVRQKNNRVRQK
jgi:hypothetical protein